MKVRLYSIEHEDVIARGVEMDAIPRIGDNLTLSGDWAADKIGHGLEVNSQLDDWVVKGISWNVAGHPEGKDRFVGGVQDDVLIELSSRHQVDIELDQMWVQTNEQGILGEAFILGPATSP